MSKPKTENVPAADPVEPFDLKMHDLLRMTGRTSPSGIWTAIRQRRFPAPYYPMQTKSPRWRSSEIEAAILRSRRSS
jgi:predicted DNA-binding transcriptional regulator AlpA